MGLLCYTQGTLVCPETAISRPLRKKKQSLILHSTVCVGYYGRINNNRNTSLEQWENVFHMFSVISENLTLSPSIRGIQAALLK